MAYQISFNESTEDRRYNDSCNSSFVECFDIHSSAIVVFWREKVFDVLEISDSGDQEVVLIEFHFVEENIDAVGLTFCRQFEAFVAPAFGRSREVEGEVGGH